MASLSPGRDGDRDLRGWLRRYGALAPAQALRVVAQLGAELGAAHRQQLVHGAVEPANVLLHTTRDGGLVARLSSAGSAVAEDPGYTAPERHGDPVPKAPGDIYSLGCVLWACLTGAPPYSGGDHQLRLADGVPVPRQLDALLEGMLRSDPADRFSSAAEIGREAAWIADLVEPPPERHVTPDAAPVTSTSAWRRIGMVGVVGLALLAVAAGGYTIAQVGDDPAGPPVQAATAAPLSSSPAPLAPASPTAVVQKRTFTCWTGRTVKSRRKCQEPHGTRGVYWLFPLLKGQNCRPREADPTPGRRMLMECYFYGRQVRMDVSLWRRASTAVAHYSARLGQPSTTRESTAQDAWDGRIGTRGYRHLTAYLWTKHAYSVAVYATRPVLGAAVRKSGYASPIPVNRYYGSPTA